MGYPLAMLLYARIRPRPVRRRAGFSPTVTVIVAARDEEASIAARVGNLLEQVYDPDRLDVVVASDGSIDRTEEIVRKLSEDEPRVQLLRVAAGGKVAAQHQASRVARGEVLAFTDANATWEPDALARLVEPLADPDVGYVCGRLELVDSGGSNKEGVYWRYELRLREAESTLGSITGGNGSIYALWRRDYVEDDPRFGHDLGLPYTTVQRGKRAVYEPLAISTEPQALSSEDEYERKVRMFAQSWGHLLTGRMLKPVDPVYAVQLFSHRVLRYASGLLHVGLLATTVRLVRHGRVYRLALAAQVGLVAAAAAGRGGRRVPGARFAHYYVTLVVATLAGLTEQLRRGTPLRWGQAAGTRKATSPDGADRDS